MVNFSMSATHSLGSGHSVEGASSFTSSWLASPNMESLTQLGSQQSQRRCIQCNPMGADYMEDGSPHLWTVLAQTQTQQQVAWGNMRNTDVLPFLERSLWVLCGEKGPCFLGCTNLEWSFCLADLAGEGRVWVFTPKPDSHCRYHILVDIME